MINEKVLLMQIPNGWKKVQIKEIISGLESGVSVNGEDRSCNEDEPAVLKVSAVTYGFFNESACKAINKTELTRAKCNPKKNSILISRSNTPDLVGASTYLDKDYPNRYLPDKLWQTIPCEKNRINFKWFSFVLTSKPIRKKLSHLATGSSKSMKNITQNAFMLLPILLPPLPEQKSIADLLSIWDEAIEKTERLVKAKEKRFRGLLQKLISEPRKTRKDTEWKRVKLGEVCAITTGKLDANAMIENGKYRFYTCAKNYYKINTYAFDTEALLISGNGANLGYIHYYNGKFNAYQRTYVLDNFPEYIDIQYLKNYLEKSLAKRIHQEKSECNTPYIRLSALSQMNISLPSIEQQNSIGKLLNFAKNEIDLLYGIIAKYKTQKRGLMQKLLTGKWRVPVTEGHGMPCPSVTGNKEKDKNIGK